MSEVDVRDLRKQLGLTQAEMGVKLGGLSRQRVCQLEKPEARIPGPIRELLKHIKYAADSVP